MIAKASLINANPLTRITIILVFLFIASSTAFGRILITYPIEYAAERSELIVIGQRGANGDEYDEFIVEQVLFGTAAKEGDKILVRHLHGYSTTVGFFRKFDEKNAPDLKDRPILLCLSRKAIYDEKAPKNAYEMQTTGSGSAIKVIDVNNVYGYYQWMNPGSYVLEIEANSLDLLIQRINRAIELGKKWSEIKAIKDSDLRKKAIMEFIKDRTLPEHFLFQGCTAVKDSSLLEIISDEIENVKDSPPKTGTMPGLLKLRYPDQRKWSRLDEALMWVECDGKELIPLLQKIKTARPASYERAVMCASNKCGPEAIPFLKEGILAFPDCTSAYFGLYRIGTEEARITLENILEKQLADKSNASWDGTIALAQKWPDAWKGFAEKIYKNYPDNEKVKGYLDHSWKSLVRIKVLTEKYLPPRYLPFKDD